MRIPISSLLLETDNTNKVEIKGELEGEQLKLPSKL